jgi:hypothetical protein
MVRSGMNAQLAQVPRIMQTFLSKGRVHDPELKGLPQERFDRLAGAMAAAFEVTSLRADVRLSLVAGLQPADMQVVLKWLESPQGRKIAAVEERAATPEFFEEYQEGIVRRSGDAERILRLRRLDSAIGGADSALNVSFATQVALITALTADLPHESRPTQEEIIDILRKATPDWRQTAERQTLQYFLESYSTVSDGDLDLYIGFAESETGRKYHTVIVQAVRDAMLRASHRIEGQRGQAAAKDRPTDEP